MMSITNTFLMITDSEIIEEKAYCDSHMTIMEASDWLNFFFLITFNHIYITVMMLKSSKIKRPKKVALAF